MAHVLVVDDEKSIRQTLSAFLTDAGHTTRVAEDGADALRLFAEESFDVVVSDLLLPRVNGLDVLRETRNRNPHVQVILITGHPTLDSAAAAVRARAFDYLAKPVSKTTILESVRRAAEAKRREDELELLQIENRRYQEKLEAMVEERTRSLRVSLAKLESVTTNSPDFIVLLDQDMCIQFINRTPPGMRGDDVLGTSIYAYLPVEIHAGVRELFARVARTGHTQVYEVPLQNAGRTTRFFRASVGPVTESGQHVGVVINAQDVTSSRKIQEELRLKDIVFESSIAANSTADKYGSITHVNSAFLSMWGYTSKQQVLGRPISDFFVNTEDTTPVLDSLTETGVWQGTFNAQRADGSSFLSQGLATVVRDENGELIGYQSANLDVTESQGLSDRLRGLFEHMGNGVAIYDVVGDGEDFVFKDMNPRGLQLCGVRSRDDVIGRSVQAVFPSVREQGLFAVLQEVWRTGEARFLPAAQYSDDRLFLWVENHVFKLLSGDVVAVFEDATERKLAQAELAALKTFYQDILDSVYDGIWVTDKADAIVYLNRTMERMADVSASEILGSTMAQGFPQETTRRLQARYEQVKASLESGDYEVEIMTTGGLATLQRGWFIPRVHAGRFDGMVCTIRDVDGK